MEKISLAERIRLFNGVGSWKTYSGDGKFPYFVMSDGPHGLRKQDEEHYADINASRVATCYPTASCSAASWDRDGIGAMSRCLALEALKEKVDVVLGCGINIKRSPLCGRNFEYFSEDPYLTGEMATAFINGMQNEGVGTSLKHFACNNQETRRQTGNSVVDERTLAEIYLRGFEKTVRHAQPYTVMSSYNRVNGEYVGQSTTLLNDFLREKWGFKGLVVSDWGACIDAAKCVKAGMDLAMPDSSGYLEGCLERSFENGEISEEELAVANERVLFLAKKVSSLRRDVEVDYKVHHEMARKVAVNSVVLLKNDGMLPLKPQKILVVGELAETMKFQGGGSSHITTALYLNAIEALKAKGFEVEYVKGYSAGFCKKSKARKLNAPLIKKAVSVVQKNINLPVLFFCGLTETYEGEGFDRTNLDLPVEQQELLEKILKINQNVCLVSFSGAPIIFPCRDKVKGILHMYLCGEAAGETVADLVSGEVNPSGKLAETFPLKIEDTPCYGNFGLETDNVEYREQELVGYRHYDTLNIPVEYDFGFGLSYTKFEYSDLKVNEKSVSVTVKNVGSVDGSEIVEVFVKNPEWGIWEDSRGKLVRAKRELRGFSKVFLKAGAIKTVTISLDDNAFKVYSVSGGGFVTVGGEYEIQVSSSLNDIRLSTVINVKGLPFHEVCEPVNDAFYAKHNVVPHKKGEFTVSDSLCDMAKKSTRVRLFLGILENLIVLTSKSKSREDPAVKIALSGMKENPVESLISTAGGIVSEKFVRRIVRWANK